MNAVVLDNYGSADGLSIRSVEPPTPGPGQIRIAVEHATVTTGDTEIRSLRMPWLFRIPIRLWLGFWRPRPGLVLGMEVAGIVDAVGDAVEGYAVGDAVYAGTPMGLGGYAELALADSGGLVAHKPADVPLDSVVALPVGGLEALAYLRRGGVAAGQRVLVRGASGSIGGYAVQLAKHHFGAHVTATCGPEGVDRMGELGADQVLDYQRRDFWQIGETWDLMLDVVGRMPIARCLRAITPGGVYIRATVPGIGEVVQALLSSAFGRRRVLVGGGEGTARDLALLGELVQQGRIRTVIDRRYALSEIREAHRYVETGHKQGNVVIDVRASP